MNIINKIIDEIEKLEVCDFSLIDTSELKTMIKKQEVMRILHKAEEEYNNGWIPCSENLPNDEEMHYVTMSNNKIGSAWYDHCSEKWYKLSYISSDVFEEVGVIAWMPLPEKYEKENK